MPRVKRRAGPRPHRYNRPPCPPTRAWDRAASLPVPVAGSPRAEVAALSRGLPRSTSCSRSCATRSSASRRCGCGSRSAPGRPGARTRHPDRRGAPPPGRGQGLSSTARAGRRATRSGSRTARQCGPIPRRARSAPGGPLRADGPRRRRRPRPARALPGLRADARRCRWSRCPELFIHPAGYCQNVLATGDCACAGTTVVGGREGDRPRVRASAHGRGRSADRPGLPRPASRWTASTASILRLEESIGGQVTRDARSPATSRTRRCRPSAFEFTFPSDTTFIY